MNKIRVFVADDHVYAAEGLRVIVDEASDMEVVGCTMDLNEVPVLVRNARPDVVVLDLAWWGDKGAGVKIFPEIRAACPDIQILAISVYPELLEPARKEGAQPLQKGFSRDDLLKAIRWAMRTKGAVQPVPEAKGLPQLTRREREVLGGIVEGLTDKQIAYRLAISEGTVKKHVSNILSKMGASSRTEAAVIAQRHYLV